jgi:alpha-1,6-mannosyltransferase
MFRRRSSHVPNLPVVAADGPAGDLRGGLALTALAAAGAAASLVCVRNTATVQSRGARRLLGPWWSWTARLGVVHHGPRTLAHGGWLVVAAVLVLTCAWLGVAALLTRRSQPAFVVVAVALLWSVPAMLAPPLLSRDAYAYLAQGAVAGHGGRFYQPPASVLAPTSSLLGAVDPMYRGHVSPYGPVAVRLFSACLWAARGQPWVALICLRLLVVVCIAATAWCGYRLAAPARRALVLWLLIASPLVILHLVGGLHVEAAVVGLLAVSLLLHDRGATGWAVGLVVLAAAVKLTAIIALPALLLHTLWSRGRASGARGLGIAAATTAAVALVLRPDPFGWVPALRGTVSVWNPISPATLSALSWATLTGGSPLTTLQLARVFFAGVGLVVGVRICLTARRRTPAATAGYLLTTATLAAPTLWPWYVVPAAVCLVLAGKPGQLVLAACLTTGAVLTGLPMRVVHMQRVSAAGEAVAFAMLVVALSALRRRAASLPTTDPEGGSHQPERTGARTLPS